MKFLLIQGANLNYLGNRKGNDISIEQIDEQIYNHAQQFGYDIEIFQSNIEGEVINKIYRSVKEGVGGILCNPGGFAHNACALRDCLNFVAPPYIEIHMTNLSKRHLRSVLSEVAIGIIEGFGTDSYLIALETMLRIVKKLS